MSTQNWYSLNPSKGLILAASLLLLGGCRHSSEELATVQQFLGLANQASEQFSLVANDIYDSCIRTAEYEPINLQSNNPSRIFVTRGQALAACEDRRSLANDLISSHSALQSYLTTLGQLATPGTSIRSIQDSVQQLGLGITSGLGKPLFDALFSALSGLEDRSRLNGIKTIVIATDDPLQRLIDSFTNVVGDVYPTYLSNEEGVIDAYYQTYLEGLLSQRTEGDTPTLTGTIANLNAQWQKDRAEIRERRTVAIQYVNLLNRIASDHHQLRETFDEGNTPTAAELNHLVETYSTALDQLMRDVQLAYEH